MENLLFIIFVIVIITIVVKKTKKKRRKGRGGRNGGSRQKSYSHGRSSTWQKTKPSPEIIGAQGEKEVIFRLGDTIVGKQYMVNNLILRYGRQMTAQIDHVFINKYGIWVIETKNLSGMIFGNKSQEKWTQVLGYGAEKHKFYNPIMQNETHVTALRECLGEGLPMKNVVVFTKADLSRLEVGFVCDLRGLEQVIWEGPDVVLSVQQMEDIYKTLWRLKTNAPSLEEHLKNISN